MQEYALPEVAPLATGLEFPEGTESKAVSLLLAGRGAEALAALNALLLDPANLHLMRLRPHARLLSGDPEGAIAELEELDHLGLSNEWLRALKERARRYAAYPLMRVELLVQARRWDDLFALYDRLVESSPDDLMIANDYAWWLATHDWPSAEEPGEPSPDARTAKAVALATRASEGVTDASKRPAYLDTLAAALFANGEVAKAIETAERAQRAAPEEERAGYARRIEGYRKRLPASDR